MHHGGHGNRTRKLMNFLFQNRSFLIGLNLALIIFLASRNQDELNEIYETGVETMDSVGGTIRAAVDFGEPCPEIPPAAAKAMGSTTNVVEYNDPDVHKTATVMAMATGYKLRDYERFVGSLRKTGYEGNIILVVAPDIPEKEEKYLKSKGVIMHKAEYTTCSHPVNEELQKKKDQLDSHTKELLTCVHPFPKLKHRWARFPLLRSLLLECGGQPDPEIQCGGPVLITDMRDTYFQRNLFGPEAPKVHGLQVFEEHYSIKTTHWLVDWPVGDCKGVHYNEPMLCSGTTIGTRQAMLDYLEIFHGEMNVWMESPKCCCFETNGDDQSMHNYMYYSGMLDKVSGGVQAIHNRNGLVHTVGALGSLIFNTHKEQKKILRKAQNHPRPQDAHEENFDLSEEEDKNSKSWLGQHYGLTDKEGYFTDYDGSRSFAIHQYDRFGHRFTDWLDANKKKIYMP